MAFSTQQNFSGVLDGTTVNDINKKIDYKKTKLEERKQVVEDLLNETEFYPTYFSEFFKATLNSGDSLSTDVNVCRSLERMANYLLNSEEIKEEEDKEVTKYVFHTDEKYFKKKVERERSLEALTESDNENVSNDIVIHFLRREGKNYKKDKTQFISNDDLKRDDWLGEILRSYAALLDHTTAELKKGKKTEYNRYFLTKVKGQAGNDMIYAKDFLDGVWGYDLKAFSESTAPNLNVFDFTNPLHLKGCMIETEKGHRIMAKGLLYFKKGDDPSSDFDHILWDLQNTIDKAGLTDFEEFVLESLRNGITQEEIALELNTYQKKISRTMDIIASKVAKVGNKYDGKPGEAV